jgi:hypothetical protein
MFEVVRMAEKNEKFRIEIDFAKISSLFDNL